MLILANALPEKTVFFTTKPLLVSGSAQAPATNPAFSFAATRAATALPVWLCENTITLAPLAVAASLITLAYNCASR